MKLTLNSYIVKRVLSDPATLTKYTHGLCKVPSGNFEKKFKEEMRILTLRRLLTLIIFLDRAREVNILDRLPMLFVKTAKVKSTSEVLITLCRDFLSAEGNIIKHLSRIGLTVSHKQSPIDEIDYTIQNLATDLRDGVRLGRMTEILTCREPKSILSMLRLPAVSRLQKLHNVRSVLEILRKDGVTSAGDIAPHHIVDGHREMVLKLMWSVLAHFGLKSLLNAESIQQEIQNVIRANATRRHHWKLGLGSALPDAVAPQNLADVGQEAFFRSLLLRWCNTVCSCFGRTVSDFTASFADGTVLCLLIHYYHPGLLPLGSISSTTKHLTLEDRSDAESYAEALQREYQNFELAQATMSELGGIPRMISIADSENPPEEKSTFLSVAYLCSRLMESSQEILACIRIQNCYGRYMRRVELEKKLVAASLILKCWRENNQKYFLNQKRMFEGPILVIERFLLSVRDQLIKMRRIRLHEEERVRAVKLIQVR
jgi:abnormal spindle-like microcephaly-associated protein